MQKSYASLKVNAFRKYETTPLRETNRVLKLPDDLRRDKVQIQNN